MGKSNKKANAEVALSVPTAASKKGKKGKRELDAELVGQLPLKKSKLSNKVPPKKKPETSSSEDSDSQSEEEDIIYADFEFFDPKQDDFHGVKNLLKTYCDGIEWDLSGFVDMILAQTTVGTVIKTDDDSLFGVITAFNIARYKDRRCIMELWKFLLHKSLKEANTVKLKAFWENNPHDVGLLVSERVVNLPIELVPPLYDALFDEVSWATEDEPTQALRESFQFKHYLLITKVYQTLQDIQGKCKETKIEIKRRKKGSSQNGDGKEQYNGQLIYIKPEDEIFHQLSSWSFTFPVHAEYQAAHEFENLKTMQLVMAVKAEKIQTFRTQLKALVDESQVVE
ncbi:protein BCCIP homolog isoform X1 [Cryptomeria japonica]|uniref:protein BCCIP homolog isoform X1 n=1 Tax=Cryptomeria japonica TaxID=3369 RepID=UPI0027D9F4BD|nr:protein BCCIP homolog isoform X1 [Cryptomeria japonica]